MHLRTRSLIFLASVAVAVAAITQTASSAAQGPQSSSARMNHGVDGPCWEDSDNRYVNCGNGTVLDTVTGLLWLQQADCLGNARQGVANQTAAALKDGDCGLTDGSSPGDWRLPTKEEWAATIAEGAALGCFTPSAPAPSLTNDAGTGCLAVGPTSFVNVRTSDYWANTTVDTRPIQGWYAGLAGGYVAKDARHVRLAVWPVRSH